MRSWIPTGVSLSKKLVENNIILVRWTVREAYLFADLAVDSCWNPLQGRRKTSSCEAFGLLRYWCSSKKNLFLIRSLNWNSRNAIQKLASFVVQRSCNLTEWFHACCFFIGYIYLGLPQGTRWRISQWVVGTSLVGQTGLIFNPQGDHEAIKDMLPYRTCNKWLQIGSNWHVPMYPCNKLLDVTLQDMLPIQI